MGQVDLLWILGFLQDLERLIPLKKSSLRAFLEIKRINSNFDFSSAI